MLTIAPDNGGANGDFTNSGSGLAEATNGGTLALAGTAIFQGGSFTAYDGSEITMDGNAELTNTKLVTLGTGYALIGSFVSVNNVTFSGQVLNPNGQLHLTGPLTNNGTLTIGSAASGGNGPTEGEINVENNAVLTNAAGHVLQGLGIIRCSLTNNGTIATRFGNADAMTLFGPTVTNGGTLTVSDNTTLAQDTSSTLTNYDASTQTLTGGTYRVNAGAHVTTLNLNIGTVAVNDATVVLSGANSVFTPMNGLTDNRGSFSLFALRQFSNTGDLTNEGTLLLDAGCTFHDAGAFVGTSGSTLAFVIGGTASSGTKSPGVLQVAGKATLAGNLNVTFASGASLPAASATLTILTAPSTLAGSFANVASGARLDTADGKGSFQVNYGASSTHGPAQVVLSNFSSKLAPTITSAETATATVGKAFSYQIKATNSPTSYGAGGLFSGITINQQTGLISGTPTAAGIHTLTLRAINATGTGTLTFTLTIDPAGPPVVTSAKTATAQVGVAFSYQITASNGPTSYGVAGLRPGLTVDSKTGLISANPPARAPSRSPSKLPTLMARAS